jgi:hypothetical protein
VVLQGGVSNIEHKQDEEEEVTSLLKEKETLSVKAISKKALFLGRDDEGTARAAEKKGNGKKQSLVLKDSLVEKDHVDEPASSAMQVEKLKEMDGVCKTVGEEASKGDSGRGRRFKKIGRERVRQEDGSVPNISGNKRAAQGDEEDAHREKKTRVDMKTDEAGLSVQPCMDQ